MRLKGVLVSFLLLNVFGSWSVAKADPKEWIAAGSAPHEYEFGSDETSKRDTGDSAPAYIKSVGSQHSGFGTLLQNSPAVPYLGKRVALSGWMRTSDAGRAQMWLRIDGADGKPVAFDNMNKHPVTGTTAWTRYTIELDVPDGAKSIAYGALLFGDGTLWADDFTLGVLAKR